MKNENEFIAHVKRNEITGVWDTQSLKTHLRETANIARDFGSAFGAGDWAETAGLWHDLGKYLEDWQNYLRIKSGYDEETHIEGLGRPNHSTIGGVLSFQSFETIIRDKQKAWSIGRILAYLVLGHHAGLPDWYPDEAGGDMQNRLFKGNQLDLNEINKIKSVLEVQGIINQKLPLSPPLTQQNPMQKTEFFQLWIRMLFSCLVDADFLNTERFMKPGKSDMRGNYPDLKTLKDRFDHYLEKKIQKSEVTPLNSNRSHILNACIEKAKQKPGFYSLNVPTGGGKTLSSMAFALEHSLKNQKKRIIIAIPYTSIIEQTAKVYKYGTDNDVEIDDLKPENWLFGEEAVLEHHSNVDPEKEDSKSQLSSENWDAPIIVTTNVQLFESLFASKPSQCRKLHNIIDSVIILDETQMLPPEYLKPVLSVLKGLVEYFGVTVILCTATQPALEGKIGSDGNSFEGLKDVSAIIEKDLSNDFKRVSIEVPNDLSIRCEWEDLASELSQYPQVLCIVNTKRDCRDLHAFMPEGTIHLSANMCGEERSGIISGIKQKLHNKEPVRVISTQLVEAGVDIDFPVVYRALSGIDSIAQAAGRCNREGELHKEGKLGKVVVFIPPKPAPSGLLRKGEEAGKSIIRTYEKIELTKELFEKYFKAFYASVNDFDKPKFQERLVKEAGEFKFQFRTFDKHFKLIDDTAQKGIFVWYKGIKKDSRDLIKKLKDFGPDSKLLRQLQRFTVNVRFDPDNTKKSVYHQLLAHGFIEEIHGYALQYRKELYQSGIGLILDPSISPEDLFV